MADASMKLELPGVDFAGMAREMIAVKLTEALVGSNEAILGIVVAAMARKVDANGNVGRYDYENKTPYVEWLAQDMVRSAPSDGKGNLARSPMSTGYSTSWRRCAPHLIA
jgi:hypothetical protein